jgi:nitrogen fixation protein NifB
MKKKEHIPLEIQNHPCFDDKARHKYGRVHLPVAPRCNIQCNFCNRQYDCLNESRPGVTSVILSPRQALVYLNNVFNLRKDISVVGIAGPGDPFANPEETLETLHMVRKAYPDILLCLATNGLNLFPYLEELAKLKISHVSITINAVDPLIGEKIYAWVRDGTDIYRGKKAAEVLLCRQLECLFGIKKHGIKAKVNTILIPGINEGHIADISRKIAEAGADIMNLIPLYSVKDTVFENIPQPTAGLLDNCRQDAARYMPIMSHCTRCRSDAVGLLGEDLSLENISLLQSCSSLPLNPEEKRPYVACASREGVLVNMHLGEAESLYIYGKEGDTYKLADVRKTPDRGDGEKRWLKLSETLKDCRALLAEAAGNSPREVLSKYGIKVISYSGLIEVGLEMVYSGKKIPASVQMRGCGCERGGGGCG